MRWDSSVSSSFRTTNGVRQGSVLSPMLFNVFVDDLIRSVKRYGFGSIIRGMYTGCCFYADDVALLSPTLFGFQKMLDVCQGFAISKLMKFNPVKSNVMIFRRSAVIAVKNADCTIGGEMLEQVHDFLHLGHVF